MNEPTTLEVEARLAELARIERPPTPVVSVHLDVRWADEQQRHRVRLFVKNELREARATGAAPADLDWIQAEVALLVEQARFPEAAGVALFACEGLGLREVIPLGVPLENALVVAEMPHLRPLAAALEQRPSAIVVFVDGESARLLPLRADGGGEEVPLESEVEGRHSRGDWAALAQSRYQRHIEEHRGQHFDAVAAVLGELIVRHGAERIVLAGEARTVANFVRALPEATARRVVGTVAGTRYEAGAVLRERAAGVLARHREQEETRTLDAALTEAAKGGPAAAGLASTLEAVNRGAVRRVWLLKSFAAPGARCAGCAALGRQRQGRCRFCDAALTPVELGEAIADRVLATGGKVEVLEGHAGLAGADGVAALLRYPLAAA